MTKPFVYETTVIADWIDYNGHMRDAFYGLTFSYAVDALQDEIGFDEDYRRRTGCTIYLVEEHKFFLKEVKLGTDLRVETIVLDCDEKCFQLHMRMLSDGAEVAVAELMELHVNQHPTPHAAPMPPEILGRLKHAQSLNAAPKFRSRAMSLRR